MSTLKVSSVQHASAASPAITLDANGQATLNGLAFPTSGSLSGRNRIINGDMRIDQRNAGASVSADNSFPVDRFRISVQGSATATSLRSTVAPTGFSNSLAYTVGTGAAQGTGSVYRVFTYLEGYNTADLMWGSPTAQPITLSFKVRSSVTGTFSGGIIEAGGGTASYVFNYTISSANTWTDIVITIPGPTIGTWQTGNLAGLGVTFDLGSGTNFEQTPGSWTGSSNKFRSSGSVVLSATNGATFYITGVQLEAGTVATPFERRSYGQELSLCQRYYETTYSTNVKPGTASANMNYLPSTSDAASNAVFIIKFAVSKRALPTNTAYRGSGVSGSWEYSRNGASGSPSVVFHQPTTEYACGYLNIGSPWVVAHINGNITSEAEL